MPSPAVQVGVDLVIFTIRSEELQVLLVRRGEAPFRGRPALPGGLLQGRETLEAAARRVLREKTRLGDVYLEQLYSFGDPGRDPRGRVISIAYYALVAADRADLPEADGPAARWASMRRLPPLAFDHGRIVRYALERLRNKLEYTTAGFQLLPRSFTLPELQRVYETILGRTLDKRNFRRKIALLRILRPTGRRRKGGRRPAMLHEFVAERFDRLKDRGILFPF